MRKQIKLGIFLFLYSILLAQNHHAIANETDRYMLIPGGDAVGIHIETEGLIVVDTYGVETTSGEKFPARDAGLVKGDVITKINNNVVTEIEEYKDCLSNNDGKITLTVKRADETIELNIEGCENTDGELTTGIYLRNKIAGIGTLTYVDPQSKKYGALGHEIIEQSTNRLVEIRNGKILSSNVTSVRKARDNEPGEKVAEINFNATHGNIIKNNEYGIYGQLSTDYFTDKNMMPIAYQDEIKLGKATILTVINGRNIEEFEIEIVEVNLQATQEIKGIKYVVTDERLVSTTGGIVQGMSGSPIVQDGKIIGAVTHVLVHDSTLGYGVFIEWMLKESEIAYRDDVNHSRLVFQPAA